MLNPISGQRRGFRAQMEQLIWWRTWSRSMMIASLGWGRHLVPIMLTEVRKGNGDQQTWGRRKHRSFRLATSEENKSGRPSLSHTTMRISSRTIRIRSQETITSLLPKHSQTQNIAQMNYEDSLIGLKNLLPWIPQRSNNKHLAEPYLEWSNQIGYFLTKSPNRLNTGNNTT